MSALNQNHDGDYTYDDGEGGRLLIQHARPTDAKGQVAIQRTGPGLYTWVKPADVEAVCDAIREASARTAVTTVQTYPKPKQPVGYDHPNGYTYYDPKDVVTIHTQPDGPVIAYGVRKQA